MWNFILQTSRRLKEVQDELEACRKKQSEDFNNHQESLEATKNHYLLEQSKLEQLLENARVEYLLELDNVIGKKINCCGRFN